MFLSAENTYLRALEPTDLEFLYALENDQSVWHVGNTLMPFSKAVLKTYLDNSTLDIHTVKQLRLVICNQRHEAVGTIDLFDFDPLHRRAGVGVVVLPAHRGNKHAAEALQLLLEYSQQTLQLHQVYCTVTATNLASLNLFQKAGFDKIGIRRDWLSTPYGWQDVVEFQRVF